MDLFVPLQGLLAGLAATAAMSAIEALAWTRWGLGAVFEWQEMQAVGKRLFARGSLEAALALHFLFGGAVGIVFAVGARAASLGPTVVLGLALGFAMWAATLVIHEPVTRHSARGVGAWVTLVSHLLYGGLLGAWA